MATRKRTRASAAKEDIGVPQELTLSTAPKTNRKKAAESVATAGRNGRSRQNIKGTYLSGLPKQLTVDQDQEEISDGLAPDDANKRQLNAHQNTVIAVGAAIANQLEDNSSKHLDLKAVDHLTTSIDPSPEQTENHQVEALKVNASTPKRHEQMDAQQDSIASTRPKRNAAKTAKAALNDAQLSSDEEYGPSSAKNTKGKGKGGHTVQQKTVKASAPAKPKAAPKGRPSVYDAERLLSSEKSKLCEIDLGNLVNEAAWALLSESDQQEALQFIPEIDKVYETMPDGTHKASLMPGFFRNRAFRDALVDFHNDIAMGRFEPKYLKEAEEASLVRMTGNLDKFKDRQFELYWGQRARPGMIAGAAANIRLSELVQAGLLKVGDVWAYKRKFLSGDIVIEKELTVTGVGENGIPHSLTFAMPPGANKFSGKKQADVIISKVVSPTTLETEILRAHPKTPNHVPNGNAFKSFHVYRKNENLGLLWEIRHTFWDGGH